MFANPLKLAGGTALPTGFLKTPLQAEGWGNSMIEAYTGNHAGHRVSRKHLKVDIAS